MSKSVDLQAFKALLNELAAAWAVQDTQAALDCFHADCTYMQPPDQQLYRGQAELGKLFSGLKPGTFMKLHNMSFDLLTQVGLVEFSFGMDGQEMADHGVAVVKLKEGLIHAWREYLAKGPADFERFTSVDGKDWQWTGDKL
jgi:ketosteroid isomerase-like protein